MDMLQEITTLLSAEQKLASIQFIVHNLKRFCKLENSVFTNYFLRRQDLRQVRAKF